MNTDLSDDFSEVLLPPIFLVVASNLRLPCGLHHAPSAIPRVSSDPSVGDLCHWRSRNISRAAIAGTGCTSRAICVLDF